MESVHLSLIRLSSSAFAIFVTWEAVSWASHNNCRSSVVAIHKELRKHSKIENKRASTSDQPAQVDQDVLSVDVGSLTGLAVAAFVPVAVRVLAADGLESEDAKDEGQVSETSEEEEESVQALGGLAASVQQDLRHATAEVEHCADVAKDLTPEGEVERRCLVVCVGTAIFGLRSRRAEVVACDSGNDYEDDGSAVEENGLQPRARLGRLCVLDGVCVFILGVHWRGRRQHGAIKIVEMVAVRRLGTSTVSSAIRAERSLQFVASTAVAYERRAL